MYGNCNGQNHDTMQIISLLYLLIRLYIYLCLNNCNGQNHDTMQIISLLYLLIRLYIYICLNNCNGQNHDTMQIISLLYLLIRLYIYLCLNKPLEYKGIENCKAIYKYIQWIFVSAFNKTSDLFALQDRNIFATQSLLANIQLLFANSYYMYMGTLI